MVYFIILVLLLIFGSLNLKNELEFKLGNMKVLHNLNGDYIYIALSSIIVMLTALRYNVGSNDYYVYKDYFNYISKGSNIIDMEVGYVLLNKFVYITFNSFNGVIFLTGIFSIGFKTLFISKYSNWPIISLMIYFSGTYIHTDFSGVRQALAIGILILFSYKYLSNNKPIKFLISVIIASLFHTSALLFLLGWIWNRTPASRKFYIVMFLITFVIGITDSISFIIGWIISLVKIELLTLKFENYFNSKILSIDLGYLINLLIFSVLLYYLPKLNKDLKLMSKLYMLSLFVYNLLIFYPISGRISLIFSIFEIILIPFIAFQISRDFNIFNLSLKIKTTIIYIFIFLYCFLKLFLLMKNSFGMFNPYQTFLYYI